MRRFGGLRPISIALCGLLAGGLFLAAFLDSGKEPAGWVSANGAAAAALEELEKGKTSGAEDPEKERQADEDGKNTGQAEASPSPGRSSGNSDDADAAGAAADSVAAGAPGAEGHAVVADAGTDAGAADAINQDGKLDINSATAEELDALKGIGPAKAQAIVDDRDANGPFKSVEDLLRVKGIGEKLLAGIKDGIVARP